MRILHVINPFRAPPGSRAAAALAAAQASIDLARHTAATLRPDLRISILAVVTPGDADAVPAFADDRALLQRNLPDVCDATPRRPLPLIADLLAPAAETDADVVVYANSDIGVQPMFYPLIARLLDEAPAFSINRRNIDPDLTETPDLPLMAAQLGAPHEGVDTFVMPRADIPAYDLGHVAIGLPFIEFCLMAAMDAACGFRSRQLRNLHATFHHGDDRVWMAHDALARHNHREARAAVERLATRLGTWPPASVFDSAQAKVNLGPPRSKRLGHKLLRALGLRPSHRWHEPFCRQPGEESA